MAEVTSTFQLESGQPAPGFTLPSADGTQHDLATLAAGKKGTLIVFACNHCPYVIHLAEAIGALAAEYQPHGIQFIAINSNDVEKYPADAPDKMSAFAEANGWDFPYLYDEDQQVAHAYAAACTPDFYLFDSDLKLAYAGQYDDSRPKKDLTPDGKDLRAALDGVLAGRDVPRPWYPSSGCNIKWKPGNEPDYFA